MNNTAGRKQVVIHEDDVGMTHGANTAFVELTKLGTCSSGSVMVLCPWFPEAVEIAARDPGLDLGVHLTLTSEQKPYRWPAEPTRRRPGVRSDHSMSGRKATAWPSSTSRAWTSMSADT